LQPSRQPLNKAIGAGDREARSLAAMRVYSIRYYHLDGYLTHRATHHAADLAEVLTWVCGTLEHDHAVLEILDDETPVWRGTPKQARAFLETRDAA
jgi:hypothetical protein